MTSTIPHPSGEAKRLHAPDRAKMEEGIRLFLQGCGLDLADVNIRSTPERVSAAWLEEFLRGYELTAAEALGELHEERIAGTEEMVMLGGIDFRSTCPHHLLPYRGVAHVAYLPAGKIAGFSRLAELVDVFAQRLTLQETLGREVADALRRELGCHGAAVLLDAEHTCMTVRGDRRPSARVITEAFSGAFAERVELRERFVSRLGRR
jgi:GTP cyclohydrolase I